MQAISTLLNTVSGFIWGPVLLVLLFGTGAFLTIGLKAMPWRHLVAGFQLLWRGRISAEKGDITPFQALMTALAATIGTGNIAGVATAIFLGGPGAVFWMWITALLGMATKYSEAVLAVKYREVDERGKYVGGPMYYIKNGLGDGWKWLGIAFALFGMIAAFGIGNMVQANSVADAMSSSFAIPDWISGVVMMVLTAVVILGGIHRIGVVAAKLVPFMAIAYVAGALWIILTHIGDVPVALASIFSDAFTGTAATGGFAGAAVWAAIRFGVARGIFSNEAGLGSAPIAHAAAQTDDPVRQVSVSVIGEGLIQLRGPIKGVNIIRRMINQIDAPVGQVRINVHTVQINGEHGDRMEKVADRIQKYIDHSRFLTTRSAEILRKAVVKVAHDQTQLGTGGVRPQEVQQCDRVSAAGDRDKDHAAVRDQPGRRATKLQLDPAGAHGQGPASASASSVRPASRSMRA